MEPTATTLMATQMRVLSKHGRTFIYHRKLEKVAILILVIDAGPTIKHLVLPIL